ncbi:MAG: hypothetical protein PUE85_05385 [Firmicutes bacterium]|nr:hypothetical protein [Bacillota bacterium]
MKKTRIKTKNIALSAVLIALGVVILYIGSIINVLDLTMAAIASLIIFFTVIELQGKYPYLIYAATGLLSALILPDKYAAVVYILFAGIYPIFKEMFERLHSVICWILKLSMFNTSLLLTIAVSVYALHIEDTGLGFTAAVLLLGNLAFVLYDIAMTKLITLYLIKLRKLFGLSDFFEEKSSASERKDGNKK